MRIDNKYIVHADDIRTLATSAEALEAQVNLVKNFAAKHFLKLNVDKCEVVVFARGHQTAAPVCEVEDPFFRWVIPGSALECGGKEISWPRNPLRKTSGRQEGPSSS